jgi:hypothetical protein
MTPRACPLPLASSTRPPHARGSALWRYLDNSRAGCHILRIAVVVATLVASMFVVPPAVAAETAGLTLAAPVQVSPSLFQLTGRTPKTQKTVILQRRVKGRWVKAARLPVVDGVYRKQVRATVDVQRYRAVAGGLRSPVRRIPARPTPDYTNPPPAAFGPLELGPLVIPPLVLLPPLELGPIQLPPLGLGTADACGAPLLDADGARRACTFADDFSEMQLDRSKWVPQTQFLTGDPTGSYACYLDDPDNVGVAHGALQLVVRKETTPVECGYGGTSSRFTSGMVSTHHLFSQAYGRFEARIKTTASSVPGLHEAFWLWPDDRQSIPVLWPEAGEIDIVETYSAYPNLAIPFLHYTDNDNGGPVPGLNTAWDCAAARGVWNTYAVEWTRSRLEIFVNGKSCLVNKSGDVAFRRKYIVSLTAALGDSTNALVPDTPIPATMSVDYVHVWE